MVFKPVLQAGGVIVVSALGFELCLAIEAEFAEVELLHVGGIGLELWGGFFA
jgi:hypothetical protein